MRLTKGTKKALSLALSTALVLTGANVGTLKADAADKDGVELTLKGETLNKKEATVKQTEKLKLQQLLQMQLQQVLLLELILERQQLLLKMLLKISI